jgi:hypothetical protein
MRPEKPCQCDQVGLGTILADADLRRCEQQINSALGRRDWTFRQREKLFFTYKGRIGFIVISKDGGNTRAIVAMPFIFGDFLVFFDLTSVLEEKLAKLASNVRLEFIPNDGSYEELWYGAITVNWLSENPDDVKVRVDSKSESRRFNWKCLATCAPACITCIQDIDCWLLCAGACVVSCAIDSYV